MYEKKAITDSRLTLSMKLLSLRCVVRSRGLRKNMVTGAAQMDGAILVVALLQMDQCHKHVRAHPVGHS
jgi:translation elongation factor EF-1alpha